MGSSVDLMKISWSKPSLQISYHDHFRTLHRYFSECFWISNNIQAKHPRRKRETGQESLERGLEHPLCFREQFSMQLSHLQDSKVTGSISKGAPTLLTDHILPASFSQRSHAWFCSLLRDSANAISSTVSFSMKTYSMFQDSGQDRWGRDAVPKSCGGKILRFPLRVTWHCRTVSPSVLWTHMCARPLLTRSFIHSIFTAYFLGDGQPPRVTPEMHRASYPGSAPREPLSTGVKSK